MKRKFAVLFGLGIFLSTFSGTIGLADSAAAGQRFDFARYCDSSEMADALRQLLPRGTPKSVVEQRLVKEGGATVQPDEPSRGKPNYFRYFRQTLCSPEDTKWWVNIAYDRNNKVRQISASGLTALFPRTPPQDRADAGIFDFEDYEEPADLTETLRALFPLDTPRAEVEKVLVKWNKAEIWTRADESKTIIYRRASRFSKPTDEHPTNGDYVWNVQVSYIDDSVSQILVDGAPTITAYKHTRNPGPERSHQQNLRQLSRLRS